MQKLKQEGTGAQAKHKRASWVREMDEAWNLTQLEKGKKNSKIRDRQPRDIEKEIVDRGEYSYKNNLRELIHIAISDYHPKNMEQFKKLLASCLLHPTVLTRNDYAICKPYVRKFILQP